MLSEDKPKVANPSAEIRAIARAIYMANHGGFEGLPNNRTAPIWESASDNVKEFCFRQALAVLRVLPRLGHVKT
jgi:hypothetical protein